MSDARRWVVAPAPGNDAAADWQHRVAAVPGVRVVAASPWIVQVEAEDEAMKGVSDILGAGFRVEPDQERGIDA